MSWRGRPNCDRICAFGEEMFALDFLKAKYSTQWCRGMWSYAKENPLEDVEDEIEELEGSEEG